MFLSFVCFHCMHNLVQGLNVVHWLSIQDCEDALEQDHHASD